MILIPTPAVTPPRRQGGEEALQRGLCFRRWRVRGGGPVQEEKLKTAAELKAARPEEETPSIIKNRGVTWRAPGGFLLCVSGDV